MTGAARSFEGIGRRLVLATHRRSGTHLSIDLLRRQFADFDARKPPLLPLDSLYLNLELLIFAGRRISERRALAHLRRAPRPIVKTHALPGFGPWRPEHAHFVDALLADADLYCVHRDGRDVLCSLHRYMQAYDPRARCSLSEFIRHKDEGVSRPRYWAQHVRAWRRTPGVRSLAYEEIVGAPRRVLERLGAELSLQPRLVEPLLPRPLRSRWQGHWLRLASRRPPATTILGAPGSGPGWRQSFSRADRAFFESETEGLLVELGYEDADDWVDDAAEAPRGAAGQT